MKSNKDIIVSLKDIFMSFDGETILNHIDLEIGKEEFVTILGPSGCGKTTTLRIIGGFLEPESGDVFFNGERINGTPPNKRNVNTIFQKYSLFPHLNVYDNVAFGLKLKKVPKDEIKKKVTKMLATVDLKGYEKRNIAKLSGGQQQRVVIARALVCDPDIAPLSVPGIISGITMVFVPSASTFLVAQYLGGTSDIMIGDIIDKIFWTDQSTGSAISLILMIFIFIFLVLMNRFGDEEAIA